MKGDTILKPEQFFKSMKEMKLEDFRLSGIICPVCEADFCEVDGHHCSIPINSELRDSTI